ncbi:hypothetical protein JP74_02995 [Devosia sp. 17-2-E-8]|nr:hypothetical protein JP74_02995 [Devosia sp. 17-2-E-8]
MRTDPQFKLRLPPELKASLEDAARRNNRSINAEIVNRLEASSMADDRLARIENLLGQLVARNG